MARNQIPQSPVKKLPRPTLALNRENVANPTQSGCSQFISALSQNVQNLVAKTKAEASGEDQYDNDSQTQANEAAKAIYAAAMRAATVEAARYVNLVEVDASQASFRDRS